MVSVLSAAGFNHLESLQEFSTRYPNISSILDSDLDNIWICHKNYHSVPKFEEINLNHHNIDFNLLYNDIKKKIESAQSFCSTFTEFDVIKIFYNIYSHFDCYLTHYIFIKCFLFYKWGLNSFEPLLSHVEIYERINITSKKLCHVKVKKAKSDWFIDFITNQHGNEIKENGCVGHARKRKRSFDLFEENYPPAQTSKKFSSKAVQNAISKFKPPLNLPRNPNDPSQEVFNLHKILYDTKERPMWSKSHILTRNDVDELLSFIIELPIGLNTIKPLSLKEDCQNWSGLRHILKIFIEKHKTLEKNSGYGRILKKHLKNGGHNSAKTLTPVPKPKVISYVLDIIRRVLPMDLFSCNRLRKQFFSSLIRIINGSKEEAFMWDPLLKYLFKNKSQLIWCREMIDDNVRNLMILKVFKFIIIHYVFIILRNNFYITETGSSGFGLRFYRKGDVVRSSSDCFNSLVYYGHLQVYKRSYSDPFTLERKWIDTGVIDERDLKRKPKKTMLGDTAFKQSVGRIRFLPKNDWSNEMRIITNVTPPKTSFLKLLSKSEEELLKIFVNRLTKRKEKLFHFKLLLDFIVEKVGTGIKPVPNNPRLETAWRKAISLKGDFGRLYFVKADIADAFNSVIHTVLAEIIEKILRKYEQELFPMKRIIEWRMIKGKIQKVARLSFSSRPKENSIMIKRSKITHSKETLPGFDSKEFLNILKQVVMEQRVEINGTLYKLIKGLAQGGAGKFSPSLCEIYYSSMDRFYLGDFINCKNSIFLRGVDDYLFITSSKEKAEKFLKLVSGGFKQFNARFNAEKLKSNLIDDIDEFSYLGLIFKFGDMSVEPDYSKYQRKDLLSTMKLSDPWGLVHFNKKRFLTRRSLGINTLKLQPILLNSSHNCLKTVRQVVFQACLIQSIRVLSLVKYLYRKERGNDLLVCQVLLKSGKKIKNSIRIGCEISKEEVRWLFLFAAVRIFKKFPGQFESLLVVMGHLLERCEKGFVNRGFGLLLNFLKTDVSTEECQKVLNDLFEEMAANTKPFRCLKEKQSHFS